MAFLRGLLTHVFQPKTAHEQQTSLGDHFASLDSSSAGKIKTNVAPEIVSRSLIGHPTSSEPKIGAVTTKDVIMMPALNGALTYVDKAAQTDGTDLSKTLGLDFSGRMSNVPSPRKPEDEVHDADCLTKPTASPNRMPYLYNEVPAPSESSMIPMVKNSRVHDGIIDRQRYSKVQMPDIEECHQSMLSLFEESSNAPTVKIPPLHSNQETKRRHHQRTTSVSSEHGISSSEDTDPRKGAWRMTIDNLKKHFDPADEYNVEVCSTNPMMFVASTKMSAQPETIPKRSISQAKHLDQRGQAGTHSSRKTDGFHAGDHTTKLDELKGQENFKEIGWSYVGSVPSDLGSLGNKSESESF